MYDKFTEVKLEFFSFTAGYLEPCLCLHRTDKYMMLFMCNDVCKMVSDLLKLLIEPDLLISVIKRGIDLICFDIHKKKNQLQEVVIRYSIQMKLNKMGEKDAVEEF